MTAAPHVLIARLDGVGDVLLAGPAVRAVAETAGRITFLAGPAGEEAAWLLPGVDDVIVFDAPWVPLDAPPFDGGSISRLIGELATRAIDEAAILTSFHQSPLPLALVLRLAGIPRIAATSVDHAGSLLDIRRRPGRDGNDGQDVHEVVRSLSLVGMLGYQPAEGDDGGLAVRRDPAGPRPFDRPYVVVHPGASAPARGWPAPRAGALVQLLADRGWCVAVTGNPGEAELTARVAGPSRPEVVDLGGATDLRLLAQVLAGAEVVVAGNTGPAHLAAAVGTPIVSVFAPVVPAPRWRPWGVPLVLLGDQGIACAGCRATACPYPDQPCIRSVTPMVVLDAVERLASQALDGRRDAELVGEGAP